VSAHYYDDPFPLTGEGRPHGVRKTGEAQRPACSCGTCTCGRHDLPLPPLGSQGTRMPDERRTGNANAKSTGDRPDESQPTSAANRADDKPLPGRLESEGVGGDPLRPSLRGGEHSNKPSVRVSRFASKTLEVRNYGT